MNQSELISATIRAIHQAHDGNNRRQEIYTDESPDGSHEFLFFLKPEITLLPDDEKIMNILSMIFQKTDAFGLRIKKAILLGASYLDTHNIIAQHYGVINALARNARDFLTEPAKEAFSHYFKVGFDECTLYGGLQMLDAFPDLTAVSLDYLWQNSSAVKLGGGAYCQALKLDGKAVYLVNGFHPRQLQHFTTPGRVIIVFTLTGNVEWSVARNNFTGKTNPADAEPGSIRRTLLENKEKFGLQTVNSSWNGIHLSAGPVESLVELIRYNSDFSAGQVLKPSDFSFGRMLESRFPAETVQKIMNNETVVHKGKNVSIFDLTEEKNNDAAIILLSEVAG
jgi:hypothetical protein